MRYPTREYQRDPPSSCTATSPSGSSNNMSLEKVKKQSRVDTGSHISIQEMGCFMNDHGDLGISIRSPWAHRANLALMENVCVAVSGAHTCAASCSAPSGWGVHPVARSAALPVRTTFLALKERTTSLTFIKPARSRIRVCSSSRPNHLNTRSCSYCVHLCRDATRASSSLTALACAFANITRNSEFVMFSHIGRISACCLVVMKGYMLIVVEYR